MSNYKIKGYKMFVKSIDFWGMTNGLVSNYIPLCAQQKTCNLHSGATKHSSLLSFCNTPMSEQFY